MERAGAECGSREEAGMGECGGVDGVRDGRKGCGDGEGVGGGAAVVDRAYRD